LTAVVRFYAYTRFSSGPWLYLSFLHDRKADHRSQTTKVALCDLGVHSRWMVLLNPDLILKLETRSYLQGVTFLGDGNDFALSVVIIVPMCLFSFVGIKSKVAAVALSVMLGILLLSVVGTSSRGAAIAISAVLLYQWSRSKKKLLGIAALAVVVVAVLTIAPPSYFERMETVKDYETESFSTGSFRCLAAQCVWRKIILCPGLVLAFRDDV